MQSATDGGGDGGGGAGENAAVLSAPVPPRRSDASLFFPQGRPGVRAAHARAIEALKPKRPARGVDEAQCWGAWNEMSLEQMQRAVRGQVQQQQQWKQQEASAALSPVATAAARSSDAAVPSASVSASFNLADLQRADSDAHLASLAHQQRERRRMHAKMLRGAPPDLDMPVPGAPRPASASWRPRANQPHSQLQTSAPTPTSVAEMRPASAAQGGIVASAPTAAIVVDATEPEWMQFSYDYAPSAERRWARDQRAVADPTPLSPGAARTLAHTRPQQHDEEEPVDDVRRLRGEAAERFHRARHAQLQADRLQAEAEAAASSAQGSGFSRAFDEKEAEWTATRSGLAIMLDKDRAVAAAAASGETAARPSTAPLVRRSNTTGAAAELHAKLEAAQAALLRARAKASAASASSSSLQSSAASLPKADDQAATIAAVASTGASSAISTRSSAMLARRASLLQATPFSFGPLPPARTSQHSSSSLSARGGPQRPPTAPPKRALERRASRFSAQLAMAPQHLRAASATVRRSSSRPSSHNGPPQQPGAGTVSSVDVFKQRLQALAQEPPQANDAPLPPTAAEEATARAAIAAAAAAAMAESAAQQKPPAVSRDVESIVVFPSFSRVSLRPSLSSMTRFLHAAPSAVDAVLRASAPENLRPSLPAIGLHQARFGMGHGCDAVTASSSSASASDHNKTSGPAAGAAAQAQPQQRALGMPLPSSMGLSSLFVEEFDDSAAARQKRPKKGAKWAEVAGDVDLLLQQSHEQRDFALAMRVSRAVEEAAAQKAQAAASVAVARARLESFARMQQQQRLKNTRAHSTPLSSSFFSSAHSSFASAIDASQDGTPLALQPSSSRFLSSAEEQHAAALADASASFGSSRAAWALAGARDHFDGIKKRWRRGGRVVDVAGWTAAGDEDGDEWNSDDDDDDGDSNEEDGDENRKDRARFPAGGVDFSADTSRALYALFHPHENDSDMRQRRPMAVLHEGPEGGEEDMEGAAKKAANGTDDAEQYRRDVAEASRSSADIRAFYQRAFSRAASSSSSMQQHQGGRFATDDSAVPPASTGDVGSSLSQQSKQATQLSHEGRIDLSAPGSRSTNVVGAASIPRSSMLRQRLNLPAPSCAASSSSFTATDTATTTSSSTVPSSSSPLESRLQNLWASLSFTPADMAAMLERFSHALHARAAAAAGGAANSVNAPGHTDGLPLTDLHALLQGWERVAALWHDQRALMAEAAEWAGSLENEHDGDGYNEGNPMACVSACGHGGIDGHGGLLEATEAAAHACLALWTSFNEIALAPAAGNSSSVGSASVHVPYPPQLQQPNTSSPPQSRPMLSALEDRVNWSCCARAWRLQKQIRLIAEEVAVQASKSAAEADAAAARQQDAATAAQRTSMQAPPVMPVYRSFASAGNRPDSGAPFVHPSPTATAAGLHPRPVIPGEFHALMRGSSVLRLPGQQARLTEDDDAANKGAEDAQVENTQLKQPQQQQQPNAGRPVSARRPLAQADHSVRPLTARNANRQATGSTANAAAKMQRRLNRENGMFV